MLTQEERYAALKEAHARGDVAAENWDLHKKYVAKERAITKAKQALVDMRHECTHVYVPDSRYYSGSYYDTAYTDYFLHCLICGHTDQTGSHDHGHYN